MPDQYIGMRKRMKSKRAKKKAPKKPARKTARSKTKRTARKVVRKPAGRAAKIAKKPVKKVRIKKVEKEEPVQQTESKKGAGSEFEVKIQNIVAFTDLGKKVSLEKVLAKLENTEYQPEQFPGLIYRMQNPRASALIFSQGKIVCTGTKSMSDLKNAMENIVKNLRSVGFNLPRKYTTTVENIVASSAIKAELNLDEIAFMLENSEYEPEQFPGLVYRISQPRVAFLLFKSGRIIITGGRTVTEVHEALAIFKHNLEKIGVKVRPVRSKK